MVYFSPLSPGFPEAEQCLGQESGLEDFWFLETWEEKA